MNPHPTTIVTVATPRRLVRITLLEEQGEDDDLRQSSAGERLGMMWQLTLDAWAFLGEPIVEPRLPRHTVRVFRAQR